MYYKIAATNPCGFQLLHSEDSSVFQRHLDPPHEDHDMYTYEVYCFDEDFRLTRQFDMSTDGVWREVGSEKELSDEEIKELPSRKLLLRNEYGSYWDMTFEGFTLQDLYQDHIGPEAFFFYEENVSLEVPRARPMRFLGDFLIAQATRSQIFNPRELENGIHEFHGRAILVKDGEIAATTPELAGSDDYFLVGEDYPRPHLHSNQFDSSGIHFSTYRTEVAKIVDGIHMDPDLDTPEQKYLLENVFGYIRGRVYIDKVDPVDLFNSDEIKECCEIAFMISEAEVNWLDSDTLLEELSKKYSGDWRIVSFEELNHNLVTMDFNIPGSSLVIERVLTPRMERKLTSHAA